MPETFTSPKPLDRREFFSWVRHGLGGAALAMLLVTALAGTAIGAQIVGTGEHLTTWRRVHFGGIIWTVCSAFFSFVVGGWVAGRITGHPRSEPAMLHGAITWLAAVPLLVVLAAFGGHFGAWYAGMTGAPAWAAPNANLLNENTYAIARNNALGALTALLLGLLGGVLGGWMASGEPMSVFHYRTRTGSIGGTQNPAPSA